MTIDDLNEVLGELRKTSEGLKKLGEISQEVVKAQSREPQWMAGINARLEEFGLIICPHTDIKSFVFAVVDRLEEEAERKVKFEARVKELEAGSEMSVREFIKDIAEKLHPIIGSTDARYLKNYLEIRHSRGLIIKGDKK